MPAGSAGNNDDATCRNQSFAVVDDCRQGDAVGIHIDASTHTVAHACRLLKDFLDHEVGVTALLELSQGDVNLFYIGMLGLVVHVDHLQLLAQAHHGDVAVVEVNHAVGIFGNGACV